jgi:chaperone required for assembly of F1-ATPase
MTDAAKGADGRPRVKIPGKESLGKPLPKRFYKSVAVSAVAPPQGEGERAYCVLLDGRRVRTPGKRDLVLPTRALAEIVAAEWAAQGERIDPATMALTRIANAVIDAAAETMDTVAADIAAFAASDLLCYRATAPAELVARQNARWDPLLTWARDELDVDLTVTAGIVHVAQPEAALRRIRTALRALDAFRLAALHIMTTLTGSAVLALAAARGRITADEAWTAAHVDEDWQIEQWGWDAQAEASRRTRRGEFDAAVRLMELMEEDRESGRPG